MLDTRTVCGRGWRPRHPENKRFVIATVAQNVRTIVGTGVSRKRGTVRERTICTCVFDAGKNEYSSIPLEGKGDRGAVVEGCTINLNLLHLGDVI